MYSLFSLALGGLFFREGSQMLVLPGHSPYLPVKSVSPFQSAISLDCSL